MKNDVYQTIYPKPKPKSQDFTAGTIITVTLFQTYMHFLTGQY